MAAWRTGRLMQLEEKSGASSRGISGPGCYVLVVVRVLIIETVRISAQYLSTPVLVRLTRNVPWSHQQRVHTPNNLTIRE